MTGSLPQVLVKDIPPYATEEFLEGLFSEVCAVHCPGGVVVKRKTNHLGQAVAFAFVTLKRRQDVECALAELNYTKLDGVPMRIMSADAETKNIMRSGRGSIILENLDPKSRLHSC
jgi:polyadenylate-binding protein